MTLCFNAKTKNFAFFIFMLMGVAACKKDTQSVGAAFVGARNKFNTQFDSTIILNSYSVKMDSVITSRLTAEAIGALNDPFLGITKASLITQYNLPANQFSWGGVDQLDSVVLQLQFRHAYNADGTSLKDYYGDKDAIHKLKVYLLQEDLSRDSSYYSTRPYQTDRIEMGSFTGKLNFTDSITVQLGSQTQIIPPHIRIKMNPTFTDFLYKGELSGAFTNSATFKERYKGLVVVDESTVNTGEGAIVYVKFSASVTMLSAFYSDSLAAYFPMNAGINGSDAAYNYYEHIALPTDLLQPLFTGQHRDTSYVQPLTGSKLRVELPNLFTALSNPKIVINGAEIVFTPLAGSNSDAFNLPVSMSLVGSDSLGKNVFLKDQYYETSAYYGGQLVNNQYRFNIVRHLQYLLDQYKNGYNYNYGMHLIIRADDPLTAERAILDTRKNNGTFKLRLTYTEIK